MEKPVYRVTEDVIFQKGTRTRDYALSILSARDQWAAILAAPAVKDPTADPMVKAAIKSLMASLAVYANIVQEIAGEVQRRSAKSITPAEVTRLESFHRRVRGHLPAGPSMPAAPPLLLVAQVVALRRLRSGPASGAELHWELRRELAAAMYPPAKDRRRDGVPATIAVYVGSADEPHVAVGGSRPIWMPHSWLDQWASASRRCECTHEGLGRIELLVASYDALLADHQGRQHANDVPVYASVALTLGAGGSGACLVQQPDESAQAYDGRTMTPKDRCFRCRRTFGYSVVWPEAEHVGKRAPPDFESSRGGTNPQRIGRCAEYGMYLACCEQASVAEHASDAPARPIPTVAELARAAAELAAIVA